MYRWFETRIDAYPEQAPERPPVTLAAFYRYFIQPVWPAFAVLLVVGFIGSVIEVSLMAFIGSIVDLMRASENPQTFLSDHAAWLLFMGFVALIARPIISTLHDLIKNQVIAGPVTTRVRWLTHRYVLRQSLSFYQNDFAGRVANKIMQTAPALRESVVQVIDAVWYAGIQWVGAVVLFAAADWRLLLPLIVWLAAYIVAMIYFVPKIRERSTAAAEARSMLTGRIVDSYTNILTVKLFAHADREDSYAKAAIDEQLSKWQASLRLLTSMEFTLYTLNGFLIVGASGACYLALEPWRGLDRGDRGRDRFGHSHCRHVGLGAVHRRRHLREHRRCAGGAGDHLARSGRRRCAGCEAARRQARRDSLRPYPLPLRAELGDHRRSLADGRAG
jgi:ATP-binding cassette subfamily B multidrug efflux pump